MPSCKIRILSTIVMAFGFAFFTHPLIVSADAAPNGLTLVNETSQWQNRTTLLKNFLNLYHADVIHEAGRPYPYSMWFFGWSVGGNDPQDASTYRICNPGYLGCDSIFYARSADGDSWQVYSGNDASGNPRFLDDTTASNVSSWVPVISSGTTLTDQFHSGDPSVVSVNGTYYMVYTASGASGEHANIYGAVSTDGFTWTKSPAPMLVYSAENSSPDPVNFGNYARPTLLYENGTFKMWFDYWTTAWGTSMGYAEFVSQTPSRNSFLNGTFTPIRAGNNPVITDWTNPDVIRVGNTYYSFAVAVEPHLTPRGSHTSDPNGAMWQGQYIVEATSPDGINWNVVGYIDSDSDCGATSLPRAYVVGNTMYLTYACQRGGTPQYDFRFKEIRRMSRPITSSVFPAPAPANAFTTSCPVLSRRLELGSRDTPVSGTQVSQLQAFLTRHFNLAPDVLSGGYFGSLTRQFVTEFQQAQGLPSIGAVGPATRERISVICGGAVDPVITPRAEPSIHPTGSLSMSPTCTIPTGQTTCQPYFDWTTANTYQATGRSVAFNIIGGSAYPSQTGYASSPLPNGTAGHGAPLAAGKYTILMYGYRGSNDWVLLDKKYFTVVGVNSSPAPTPAPASVTSVPVTPAINKLPTGYFDIADCTRMVGWAFDPNASSSSIVIIVKEGNVSRLRGTADLFRGDVNRVMDVVGNHGFYLPTPASLKDGLPHSLKLYAVDNETGAESVLGPLAAKTLTCGTVAPAPAPTPAAVTPAPPATGDSRVPTGSLTLPPTCTIPSGQTACQPYFDWITTNTYPGSAGSVTFNIIGGSAYPSETTYASHPSPTGNGGHGAVLSAGAYTIKLYGFSKEANTWVLLDQKNVVVAPASNASAKTKQTASVLTPLQRIMGSMLQIFR